MLGFAEQLVLEAPDSVRRVAATGMVGRRDQANRATVPPAHIACSQGWTLKRVRQGPKRWPWSGREPSRPKPLDIKGPIQGPKRWPWSGREPSRPKPPDIKGPRQGPKRWPWSGREPSRPKPLDIKGPIQGPK